MTLPRFAPMLPVSQRVDDDAFVHEIKWDGYRALAYLGEEVRLDSRNGKSLNSRFPAIVSELEQLIPGVILDGEIVALGPQGHPDFSLLRNAINSTKQILYIVFDLLYLEEHSICSEPWSKRRRHLEQFLEKQRRPEPSLSRLSCRGQLRIALPSLSSINLKALFLSRRILLIYQGYAQLFGGSRN